MERRHHNRLIDLVLESEMVGAFGDAAGFEFDKGDETCKEVVGLGPHLFGRGFGKVDV